MCHKTWIRNIFISTNSITIITSTFCPAHVFATNARYVWNEYKCTPFVVQFKLFQNGVHMSYMFDECSPYYYVTVSVDHQLLKLWLFAPISAHYLSDNRVRGRRTYKRTNKLKCLYFRETKKCKSLFLALSFFTSIYFIYNICHTTTSKRLSYITTTNPDLSALATILHYVILVHKYWLRFVTQNQNLSIYNKAA